MNNITYTTTDFLPGQPVLYRKPIEPFGFDAVFAQVSTKHDDNTYTIYVRHFNGDWYYTKHRVAANQLRHIKD